MKRKFKVKDIYKTKSYNTEKDILNTMYGVTSKEDIMNKREECLRMANEIVNGAREKDYGTPEDNLQFIADQWASGLHEGLHEGMKMKMNAKELLNALNTTIPKLKEKEPNLEIKSVEYHRDVIANVVYPSGEEKELILARKVVSFDAKTLEVLKVEPIEGANDEL